MPQRYHGLDYSFSLCASLFFSLLISCHKNNAPVARHFKLAIAEPLRFDSVESLEKDVKLYEQNGYNAIWIENDYLRWSFKPDPDNGFDGNWRLFNIFDFTYGSHLKQYNDLRKLNRSEDEDLF